MSTKTYMDEDTHRERVREREREREGERVREREGERVRERREEGEKDIFYQLSQAACSVSAAAVAELCSLLSPPASPSTSCAAAEHTHTHTHTHTMLVTTYMMLCNTCVVSHDHSWPAALSPRVLAEAAASPPGAESLPTAAATPTAQKINRHPTLFLSLNPLQCTRTSLCCRISLLSLAPPVVVEEEEAGGCGLGVACSCEATAGRSPLALDDYREAHKMFYMIRTHHTHKPHPQTTHYVWHKV